jgi:FAD:protein FMN transferase
MEHRRDSLRRAKPLLGTFVEICAAGAPEDLEAAIEAAFCAIEKVHRLMSFHETGSDVSRLNRDARATAVKVHPWTFRVLEAALELNRQSGGLFDIAVAAQRLSFCEKSPNQPEPPGISLADGFHVRFGAPDIAIDLGGIAKGFAVDCAVEVLKGKKVASALVNAGGDLAAFGSEAFPVHIREPGNPGRIACEIYLQDEALATSGPRLDGLPASNTATPATMDPRTMMPAAAIAGATVVAPACMIADALTKAVMIAGEDARNILDYYHADALIFDHDGGIRSTAKLQEAFSRAA